MPTSMRQGFDNEKYIELQAANIRKRIAQFGGKLYLEFGGKLFDDYHASRVALPGFEPAPVPHVGKSGGRCGIVIAINANHIEKGKTRGDLGIPYDEDVLRLIDVFRSRGFLVGSVVLTQYAKSARRRRLPPPPRATRRHLPPALPDRRIPARHRTHRFRRRIRQERVHRDHPAARLVTAPGPGSGKLATCLSQLYHEHQRGIDAAMPNTRRSPSGIFRSTIRSTSRTRLPPSTSTMPISSTRSIWRRTARPPSTTTATSRSSPVVNAMFELIAGKSPYKSPTDMGVNMAGNCIVDDEACREAPRNEIIRRYFKALCDQKTGKNVENELFKT